MLMILSDNKAVLRAIMSELRVIQRNVPELDSTLSQSRIESLQVQVLEFRVQTLEFRLGLLNWTLDSDFGLGFGL